MLYLFRKPIGFPKVTITPESYFQNLYQDFQQDVKIFWYAVKILVLYIQTVNLSNKYTCEKSPKL